MSDTDEREADQTARRYRVVVDRDLCQGHGVCENEAPHVFELAEKATTVTVLDESPPESERAAVEAAVRYCPTHALSIEEIDS
jgi:sterol 14-demethylase